MIPGEKSSSTNRISQLPTVGPTKRNAILGGLRALKDRRTRHQLPNKRSHPAPQTQKIVRFDTCQKTSCLSMVAKHSWASNQGSYQYETEEISDCPSTTEKEECWYSMKELNTLFLKDLEEQHQDLLESANSFSNDANPLSSISSGATEQYTNRFRGLEFHLPHNHHKVEQNSRYVRAVVERSYKLYQTASRMHGRLHPSWSRLVPNSKHATNRRLAAEMELAEFASQYTHQTREHALGVGARDEAEARSVHKRASSKANRCQLGDEAECIPTKTSCGDRTGVALASPVKADCGVRTSSSSLGILHEKLKSPVRSSITAKSA